MKLRLFPTAFLAAVLLGCVKDQVPQEMVDNDPDVIDYVDEYGVNHGPGIKIGIHVWAPVNCGYHATDYKYGKMYQWGRKYGQGFGDDATVPNRENGAVSLDIGNDKSNENVTFIGSYDSRYDWLSPQNHLLWNSGPEFEPVKTEFDPCPEGWRVPNYAELDELFKNYSAFTTDVNGRAGRWFSGPKPYSVDVPQIFLPVSSKYLNGQYLRGDNAYYWSSSPEGQQSLLIYFSRKSVQQRPAGDYRHSSYSVRCILE